MKTFLMFCLAVILISVGYFAALSMDVAWIGLLLAFGAWTLLLARLMGGSKG